MEVSATRNTHCAPRGDSVHYGVGSLSSHHRIVGKATPRREKATGSVNILASFQFKRVSTIWEYIYMRPYGFANTHHTYKYLRIYSSIRTASQHTNDRLCVCVCVRVSVCSGDLDSLVLFSPSTKSLIRPMSVPRIAITDKL